MHLEHCGDLFSVTREVLEKICFFTEHWKVSAKISEEIFHQLDEFYSE